MLTHHFFHKILLSLFLMLISNTSFALLNQEAAGKLVQFKVNNLTPTTLFFVENSASLGQWSSKIHQYAQINSGTTQGQFRSETFNTCPFASCGRTLFKICTERSYSCPQYCQFLVENSTKGQHSARLIRAQSMECRINAYVQLNSYSVIIDILSIDPLPNQSSSQVVTS